MNVLEILYLMLELVADRGARDLAYRYELAVAIASETPDDAEQSTLLTIAGVESGYRIDVATCRTRGDGGRALGPFQVHARSPGEKHAICTDLRAATRIALERVRESIASCGDLTGYVSGRCGVGRLEAMRRAGR